MVKIKALNGLTYSKGKINDFSKVITPPNDVISKEEKEEFKNKSKYNFVNLILPNGNGDKYKNAFNLFNEWQQKNILETDKEKTVYIYSHSYSANGKTFNRLGFIALLKLEGLGKGVLPHEKSSEKELKDRVALISTTKADFGIPFLLYDDRAKITDELIKAEIEGKEPYMDFIDGQEVNHKLWKTTDSGFFKKLSVEMEKHQCIIADGHHRYISELRVWGMLKNIKDAEYGLMCFVNSFNSGMVILPTNRIVFGLKNSDISTFLEQLKKYFEVEEIKNIEDVTKKVESTEIMIDKKINLKNHVIGVYSNINKKGYFLKLKNNDILDKFFPDKTNIYRKLDVNILHKIIIEEILGVPEEQQRTREYVDFIKGNEETIEKMKDESIQFAFFINPPLMREVFLTARANETMPMKSTYFFPKVFSGLVTYKFGGGANGK